jgi:hypothetical protein
MTIYEIYVHGEFYEAWEEGTDAYLRAMKLIPVYGEDAIYVEEHQVNLGI